MSTHKGNCALCGDERTFVHGRELAYGKTIAVLGAVVFTFPRALLVVLSSVAMHNSGEFVIGLGTTSALGGLVSLAAGGFGLPIAWFGFLLVFLGMGCARGQDILACRPCGYLRPRLSDRSRAAASE